MNAEIKEKFPEWAERYEEMQSLLLRIYYSRLAMNHDGVVAALDEVDNLFREENYN